MIIFRNTRPSVVAAVILAGITASAVSAHDHLQNASAQHDHPDAVEIGAEAAYLAHNDAAMDKMMADMEVKPTGNVDRDFVLMMTPHHQGAIDMARAVLKYGKNEQLRRIAQEIIVDQQQEIAAMKLAIGDTLPPSGPAPTQVAPETAPARSMPSQVMPGMDPNMKM
ncbi:DUF305 domain-containing protein [Rhizobium sp. SAFR-030]|uniref:DUF305 domain-containing protein n=1 Tax=Rhizobium sp. SAFR-030 TaxID=3387277 RepID=UPI003F80EB70